MSSGAPRPNMRGPFIGRCCVHQGSRRVPQRQPRHAADGAARRRCRRGPLTWKGTAPAPTMMRFDPERLPSGDLLPHLLLRCRRAGRIGRRRSRRPSDAAGRRDCAEVLEPASQIGLVLADQRVQAERAPDRRRVATDRARTRPRAPRDVRGTRPSVHVQHVFQPSACSATSRSNRSPLPPTNTRGRGCCSAGGRFTASCARWKRPSYVNGPPPSSPVTTSTASARRASRSPGRGIFMPIASYSGSYQPAPRPTSSRPPETRSRVASDFASTDAGRNASHMTSVPSRTSTTRASAPSVTSGS